MNLTFLTGLAGAAVLAVLFAAAAFLPWLPSTFFGPAGSPSPSPVPTLTAPATPEPSSTPSASPVAPTFLAGDVPFEGTDWLLVGRIDGARGTGDPAYISPAGDRPATLRFVGGVVDGSDGCVALTGTYDADPRGPRTAPADITLEPLGDVAACADPIRAQHLALRDGLDGAGGVQVTTGAYDVLASGLTDADLDAELLDHYKAFPDLVRLVIRDQSGEGTLIYAPVGRRADPATVEVLTSPQPLLETDWRVEAVADGEGGLSNVSLASGAGIRFTREGGSDRFESETGCGALDGDWAIGPRTGIGEARTLNLVLGDPVTGPCTTTAAQADRIAAALAGVGSVEAIDRTVDATVLGVSSDGLDVDLRRELTIHPQASMQLLRDRLGTPLLLLIAVSPDPVAPADAG